MFGYYLNLALRSFRRNRVLTALMVLAIALGIGACMTTLTVFRVLSGDPIPHKSDRLFYIQLDPQSMQGFTPGDEPAFQMTRFDSETLLREKRGHRQAMMTGGAVAVTPERQDVPAFMTVARYTSADFFPMFDTPFLHGGGWSGGDDEAQARVAVLSREMARRLFGEANPVGRTVRLDQADFSVVGVLDEWQPSPRFYDMTLDSYGQRDEIFLPISTAVALQMGRNGSMDCWGDSNGDQTSLNAPCTWIQYWVELDSPSKAGDYRAYLENYSELQRAAGRFERPTNVRMRNVMELLEFNRVVPGDVVMQLWLGVGFLLVCLLNTVGLLLAKFLRRSSEIGVRRALGASRLEIFKQFLVEAGVVGLAGGVLGLGLALLGLWGVRQQPVGYAELARLDLGMLVATFAIAIAASLLAGMLPAWRAVQVSPALQLKSQ